MFPALYCCGQYMESPFCASVTPGDFWFTAYSHPHWWPICPGAPAAGRLSLNAQTEMQRWRDSASTAGRGRPQGEITKLSWQLQGAFYIIQTDRGNLSFPLCSKLPVISYSTWPHCSAWLKCDFFYRRGLTRQQIQREHSWDLPHHVEVSQIENSLALVKCGWRNA